MNTFGLDISTVEAIRAVFDRQPKLEKVMIYGSRAKGNYRPGSDIDLSLLGKALTLDDLFAIEQALDELLLPFTFDLSLHHHISNPDLLEHIDRVGKVFWERGEETDEMNKGMGEWKDVELSEVIEFGNGKKKPDSEGDIPIYGGNGILGYSADSNYENETIIIGRVGAYCGSVYYENKPIWVSDNALAAKAKSGNSTKFLYYFLRNANLNQHAGGSSHPLVTQTLLNSLEYEICVDEKDQKAIASILSSLDDKIDLLHRQNQTLEALAETLFRQWFVEEAGEGWEWQQLDKFVEVQRGLSYKGAGLTDADDGVPMHNLNSIYEGGGYKEEGIKYYKGEFKDRHKVFPGDVIISNTEQGHEHLLIGYPAMVPANFGDYGIFSQHIYRLEIKSELSNFFLFHLLKTHDVHEQIAGATNGSTVNMLPKDGVEWAKFRMPPQEMIGTFTQIAYDYYKKQEFNQFQIRTLTALRDTLLPKLMSGEVSVESFNNKKFQPETND